MGGRRPIIASNRCPRPWRKPCVCGRLTRHRNLDVCGRFGGLVAVLSLIAALGSTGPARAQPLRTLSASATWESGQWRADVAEGSVVRRLSGGRVALDAAWGDVSVRIGYRLLSQRNTDTASDNDSGGHDGRSRSHAASLVVNYRQPWIELGAGPAWRTRPSRRGQITRFLPASQLRLGPLSWPHIELSAFDLGARPHMPGVARASLAIPLGSGRIWLGALLDEPVERGWLTGAGGSVPLSDHLGLSVGAGVDPTRPSNYVMLAVGLVAHQRWAEGDCSQETAPERRRAQR